jgi:hypothetical protein
MAELTQGKFYRMPNEDHTVVQAEPVGRWWHLTDVAAMRERPSADPMTWPMWAVAPDGTIYMGAPVQSISNPTYAPGGPTAMHRDDLVEVVPSGMDYPPSDFQYWCPVDGVPSTGGTPHGLEYAGLPEGYTEGYPGFEDAAWPSPDEPVWAAALPTPPVFTGPPAHAVHSAVDRSAIAIKYNNLSAAEPCALCGDTADQDVGPGLFLANSYDQVCWKCGEKQAPELTAMLRAWLEIH